MVIVWGSVVRALGAGMGCGPDWPTCNGEVVPSNLYSLPVFLEYFHRIIGGLAFIAVTYSTYRLYKEYGAENRVSRLAFLSLTLLIVQVLLGMILVKLDLDPVASAVHLSLATVVFGSLVFLYSELGRARFR